MCSGCKMDDKDVQVMYARQGAVEVSDFDEEPRYRKVTTGKRWNYNKKKPRKKTRPGCPENNFGPHLFVWTTELESEKTLFFKFYGFHKYQREVCCGCGKRRNSELTERYIKRKDRAWEKFSDLPKGEPVPRWRYRGTPRRVHYSYFTWENEDKGFAAFKKAEAERRGILNVDVDGRWLGLY